jgi:Flp pilus assembly protein protease CpaA
MNEFLFWFFLAGILIATFQDLKRREIDVWLCTILLIGGISYIVFKSIFETNTLLPLLISLITLLILMNIFYYGRIFAGGDARLLLALSAIFVTTNIFNTLTNIGTYIILLLFSGAIYGLIMMKILYLKNWKKINRNLKPKLKKIKYQFILLLGIILIALSTINPLFSLAGVLIIIYPPLFFLSKEIEKTALIKEKPTNKLQEGDWLDRTIKVKNRTIKYSWDGLTKEDIKFLKKHKKKVKIKDGLPYAPAFLIAHIIYFLLKNLTNIIN